MDSSSGVSLSGSTNNQVTTVTGSSALQGEPNLTFDGTVLAVTGNITATTSIANDAVSIVDNVVTATRSNDDLILKASGTGLYFRNSNIVSGAVGELISKSKATALAIALG